MLTRRYLRQSAFRRLSVAVLFLVVSAPLLVSRVAAEPVDCHSAKGDLNANNLAYEVSDLLVMIDIVFRAQPPGPNLSECWPGRADLDGNGRLNLVDVVWMWQIITGERQPGP